MVFEQRLENIDNRLAAVEKAERHFQTNWMAQIEWQLDDIRRKAAILERAFSEADKQKEEPSVLELDLTLPEADIDGLHFNEQKVHAVFEKQEDGWWHSRDILFLSARNTEDDNSRDILSEYMKSDPVQDAFLVALNKEDINIEISLPKENEGVKKYNGVDWWYWIAEAYTGSMTFVTVHDGGNASYHIASSVGGCAPAFCVA